MRLSPSSTHHAGLTLCFPLLVRAVVSPFQGLDKATVLQETKIFSDANTVTRHPKKCCQLITKLLHILTQGEPFTSAETTAVFFGVTKLFQSKDANLRRMMYLSLRRWPRPLLPTRYSSTYKLNAAMLLMGAAEP
jgi:hypothetical protein